MKKLLLLLVLLLAMPSFAAESVKPYGERLEGFDYPYPVKNYDFTSQKQKLSMSYMDVAAREPAKGRVAVLLHGKNFCGATWEATIHTLSDHGYRVIAPDQVGFCKSTKPRGYQFSFNQLAVNTHDLLRSLGIHKATVIGHSIGGMLAMRYAIDFADNVEQLVLVNPIGLEDWQAEGVPYASIDALYQNELKTSFDSIKAYQQRMYFDGQWKDDYDRWVGMQAGLYAGKGKDIVAWNQAQTSDMLFNQPVIYEAKRIKAPTLLLIGGRDRTAPGSVRAPQEIAQRLGDYPIIARRLQGAIPNATLVEFPTLGHAPQVEAPVEFHKALLDGLTRN